MSRGCCGQPGRPWPGPVLPALLKAQLIRVFLTPCICMNSQSDLGDHCEILSPRRRVVPNVYIVSVFILTAHRQHT